MVSTILHVILCVLGIVLLVIICVLLLVLFCPIRYKIAGKSEGGIEGNVKVSFCLVLLRFGLQYRSEEEDGIHWKLRVFGIPILSSDQKRKKEKQQKKEKKTPAAHTTEISEQKPLRVKSEAQVEERVESQVKDAVEDQAGFSDVDEKLKRSQKKFAPFSTAKKWKEKISHIPEWIQEWKRKFHRIKRELTDERNQAAVKHGVQEMLGLLKHYMPRRGRAKVTFSLEDPGNTGYITGVLSLFPFVYRKDVQVIPDFEKRENAITGDAYLVGQIQLIFLLLAGIRVLRDKNIRRLWKHWKGE